jgi:hypothetical protein
MTFQAVFEQFFFFKEVLMSSSCSQNLKISNNTNNSDETGINYFILHDSRQCICGKTEKPTEQARQKIEKPWQHGT